jgi:glycosyltransferase involved in cell wall biosynthesis
MNKVIRIIARLNVGGPAKHVSWVSDGLQKKNWPHILVHGAIEENEDDYGKQTQKLGLDMRLIPDLGRSIHPIKDLKVLWKIYALLRAQKPAVLHTHASKAGFVGRGAALIYNLFHRPKIKVVHTFHGHTFHGYFNPVMEIIFLRIERFLARFATDRIITISRQQQSEILGEFRVGKKSQHEIVPLGVDFTFSEELHKTKLRELNNIPLEHKVIGIVGRIAPVKNHPSFLRLCKKLERENPELSFLVIGGGSQEDMQELKNYCEELGIERLRFAGNVENPRWIYGSLDVLVVTSKNEGTPVSILEAFACRIPGVSTRAGGTIDLIGENQERGYLVDQGNSQDTELARCIQTALASGRSDSKVQAAYEFVVANYSVERLCEDLDKLYLSVIPEATRDASFSNNKS